MDLCVNECVQYLGAFLILLNESSTMFCLFLIRFYFPNRNETFISINFRNFFSLGERSQIIILLLGTTFNCLYLFINAVNATNIVAKFF